MAHVKFVCLLSLLLTIFAAHRGFAEDLFPDYSKEQKAKIYATLSLQEVETFLTYQALKDLEVPLLITAIDRTHLASGSVEFARLLQPTSNMDKLQRRRLILEELLKNDSTLFEALEQTLREFSNKDENLFISLVDGDILPNMSASSKLGTGIVTTVMSLLALGDTKRHIISDRANMRQTSWLSWLNSARSIYIEIIGGIYLSYYAYQNLNEAYQTIDETDQFVFKFARAVMVMEKINAIIQSSATLSNAFPAFQDFKNISRQDQNLAWTLEKLASRADAQDSFWAYWHMKDSMILYDQIRSLKMQFANILWWISRIDAYMSVIRWIKEREKNGEDVTFVTYIKDAHRPQYQLQNLTNPTIENSVANDFNINGHAILTGPHALGKTSSMRSIAYAHIMGQSIVVVPAKKAAFAPVFNIKTYFNVGDSNGESSFQAELRRMTELLAFATQNSSNQPILFFIDEPFAKTPSLVGNHLMQQFLNKTVDAPNLSMLLSTHLEIPSQFAENHKDVMQNLQPEVRKINSNFLTTYKIVPGAAHWWFENEDNQTNDYIKWLMSKQLDTVKLWFE